MEGVDGVAHAEKTKGAILASALTPRAARWYRRRWPRGPRRPLLPSSLPERIRSREENDAGVSPGRPVGGAGRRCRLGGHGQEAGSRLEERARREGAMPGWMR